MRRFTFILVVLLLVSPFLYLNAQEEENPEEPQSVQEPETPTDDADEASPPQQAPKAPATTAPGEEPFDEGLFEDEETPADATAGAKAGAGNDEEKGFVPRKITIDAVVIVNYSFADSGESYNVKYHINMGGEVKADIGIIKGGAKVATDIGGFLAKTSAFECLLKVSIADVPYEIAYRKTSDTTADINVSFKGQIMEDWESLCTFLDTSHAKFNTRGAPEKWISLALEKADPPIGKLTAPIDRVKTTTLKFSVPRQSVPDESLGTAQLEATGIVTIQPVKRQEKLPEKVSGE